MNGVQTRFKCKLDVKRCKRFVFPPSSLLPRSNALKTKAIRYFQTDRTLTRIVSPPLHIYRETLSPFPVNNLNQQLESKSEKDVVEKEVLINGKKNSKVYLTPQKIDEINQLLQTPEFIYDQKIKLEQFAQRVAVNSTYLNRYFNQEYGCSFLQYLTSLRIEQAEMLLRDSNAEIEDICYNTGFNSPSAFHKAFKNRYGYSPSEWRRRCLT